MVSGCGLSVEIKVAIDTYRLLLKHYNIWIHLLNTRGFEDMRGWEFPDKTVQYEHPAMLKESDDKRIYFLI